MQWQREIQIYVIDSHHEAMVVVDHLIAGQKESQRQGEQENHQRATQEAAFQSALQAKQGRVKLTHIAHFRKLVAKLPAARGDPVDQHADNDQGQ